MSKRVLALLIGIKTMSIKPGNLSITPSLGASNKGTKNASGVNGAIKSVTALAKTSTSPSDADSKTNASDDDAKVATGDEDSQSEAGKTESKDPDKVASETIKNLYKGYYDFEKAKLDNQRGMQQDQLDMQKQMAQMQADAQAKQQGMQALAGLGGQLAGAFKGLGGGGSGGGSSGSGSAGKPDPKDVAENEKEKEGFEDKDKVVKLDAKGNPILGADGQPIQGQPIPGQTAPGQLTHSQLVQGSQAGQSPQDLQATVSQNNYNGMHFADANAQNYDRDNGFSVTFPEMRSDKEDFKFDLDNDLAKNDNQDMFSQIDQTPEAPEPLDLEIDIEEDLV